MWEKKKSTTECGKNTVKCDISTTQYDNGTIKCEKKNKVPLYVTKVQSDLMFLLPNVTMKPSNVSKK